MTKNRPEPNNLERRKPVKKPKKIEPLHGPEHPDVARARGLKRGEIGQKASIKESGDEHSPAGPSPATQDPDPDDVFILKRRPD